MHILIIPIGFVLWYLAYEAKPINNDEATFTWEEENFVKRTRLLNILKEGFKWLGYNYCNSIKAMNFKERGLTVGDLLIILIFIISTVFIVNKFRDGDKQTFFYMSPNEITALIKN